MKLFAILSLLAVTSTSAAELSREERAKVYLESGGKLPTRITANEGGAPGRELFSVTTGPNTCYDSCGGPSEDGSCWCDALCSNYGDCCNTASIFCPELGTCEGSCGGSPSVPGCSCDESCKLFDICCHDFEDQCDFPYCNGQCGSFVYNDGGDAFCYCDEACDLPEYDDCCVDKYMSYCPSRKLGEEAADFEAAMKLREKIGSGKKVVDEGARRATRKSLDGGARRAVRGREGGARGAE